MGKCTSFFPPGPADWISTLNIYFDQIVVRCCFLVYCFRIIIVLKVIQHCTEKALIAICSFLNSFVLNYVIDEGVSPLGKTTFQSRLQACKHLGMVC